FGAATQSIAVHSVEDSSVHRLETITDIWQRTINNHTHRVTEVAVLHNVLDGAALNRARVTTVKNIRLFFDPSALFVHCALIKWLFGYWVVVCLIVHIKYPNPLRILRWLE